MKETTICSAALSPAKRETFQSAVNPSRLISCRVGRKRPWKEGCGQSARMEIDVSAPRGEMAKDSDPPISSEKEKASACGAAPVRSCSGACKPPGRLASPEPGTKL